MPRLCRALFVSVLLLSSLQVYSDDRTARHARAATVNPAAGFPWIRDAQGRELYYVEFLEPPAVAALLKSDAKPGNDLATRIASPATRSLRKEIATQQAQVLEKAALAVGHPLTVATRHDLLLNGITAYLSREDARRLRGVAGVRRVMPVPARTLHTDRGPVFIGSPVIWSGSDGGIATRGEGVIIGILDSGIDPEHPSFADIGDDGFDHTNPFGAGNYLGDCVQPEFETLCNDKLIGIVSYPEITDRFPPREPAVGIDLVGHGTHVASIAAGNELHDVHVYENVHGGEADMVLPVISGVAPHANIVSYQVCRPPNDGAGDAVEGSACLTNYTVEALEHAIENGVDVVNYSVGGWPDDPWLAMDSLAFLNARKAGIHVATSAGNSGPSAATVGGPANAPWLLSVGAATHDRAFSEKTLGNFAGGDTPAPEPLTGAGWTSGVRASIVWAGNIDPGNGLCGYPFAPGTFQNGEIVVCARGDSPRIEKGINVRHGGGGGLVLINVRGDEDNNQQNLVDDLHVIPAVHLSADDGEALMTWLSSGTGHVAEISESVHGADPAGADIVTFFSSRGPNYPFETIPAVHVNAPGANIFGAYAADPFFMGNGELDIPFAFLSGTSMSSPHVAGALALLDARHPDWTGAEMQSAVMLASAPGMRMEHLDEATAELGTVDADIHAEGSGSLRVAAAAAAGLVMPITHEQYVEAAPSTGGDLRQLNFPALLDMSCVIRCEWQRRFRAVTAANWTIAGDSAEESIAINASPPTIAANEGEEFTVTFSAELAEYRGDESVPGRVWFTPAAGGLPALQMPMLMRFHAGLAPDSVELEVNRSHGLIVIPGIKAVGTQNLHATVSGFATSVSHEASIPADATPDVYYDDMQTVWHWVELEATRETTLLAARITEAVAPDLDLFVVRDSDSDGKPDLIEFDSEYSCVSGAAHSMEECVLTDVVPGKYFVGVHNYTGSGAETDRHVLETVVLDRADEGNLVLDASGPREPGEEFSLEGQWSIGLEQGQSAFAIVSLGLSSETAGDIGDVAIRLVRGPDDTRIEPVASSVTQGEDLRADIVVAANTGGHARSYVLTMPLPDAALLKSLDPAWTQEGDTLQAAVHQSAGGGERRFSVTFGTDTLEAPANLLLELSSTLTERGISLPLERNEVQVSIVEKPVEPPPASASNSGGGGALASLLPWLAVLLWWRRGNARRPGVHQRGGVTMMQGGGSVLILLLASVLLASGCREDGNGIVDDNYPDETGWPDPACDSPAGTFAVGFSQDGGATVQLLDEADPAGFSYTGGLVTLETPGWMLASYSDGAYGYFLRSKDSGCTWNELGRIEFMDFPVLEASAGNTAYAWDWYTNQLIHVDATVDGQDALEEREFPFAWSPGGAVTQQVQGVGVAADDGDEIAYFNDRGSIHYSRDGGRTWLPEDFHLLPEVASNPFGIFYNATFDRNDLNHVVIGTIDQGAHVTFDGGITWHEPVISSVSHGDIFFYNVAFTPNNSDVVWALGKDLDESAGGAPTQGRHIYRSADGGLSFQIAIDHVPNEATLTNSTLLAPPPGRPNELYFEFFSCFNWSPGEEVEGVTDIFHFDLETGEVTRYWNEDLEGVHSMAFSPDDPNLMYLGLDKDPRC